jgi:hypothetical protein
MYFLSPSRAEGLRRVWRSDLGHADLRRINRERSVPAFKEIVRLGG